MSFSQRDNGGLVAFIVVLVFSGLLVIAIVVNFVHQEERCEANGGTYYCGYKSSCLCLASGTVLP